MRPVLLVLVLLGGSATAAGPKHANKSPAGARPVPPPTPEDTGPAGAGGATHHEGDYGGVVPGHPQLPAKPKRMPAKGTLSWVGFEARSGGADVFLQSVAPFELAQHVENGTLVVELSGLTRLGQNTWRPVDARFFDSPIGRITARRVGATRGKHGAGIEVRITFKTPKDAKEGAFRSATEADGMYYAYLSFGGGGGAGDATTLQEPEK